MLRSAIFSCKKVTKDAHALLPASITRTNRKRQVDSMETCRYSATDSLYIGLLLSPKFIREKRITNSSSEIFYNPVAHSSRIIK